MHFGCFERILEEIANETPNFDVWNFKFSKSTTWSTLQLVNLSTREQYKSSRTVPNCKSFGGKFPFSTCTNHQFGSLFICWLRSCKFNYSLFLCFCAFLNLSLQLQLSRSIFSKVQASDSYATGPPMPVESGSSYSSAVMSPPAPPPRSLFFNLYSKWLNFCSSISTELLTEL